MPDAGGLIPAIVLAAGASVRMGANKLLLPLHGRPVLHWALQALLDSPGVGDITVVTGYEAETVAACCAQLNPAIRCVYNPNYAQGRSTSVQTGLRALPPNALAALITPGDVPLITPQLVTALVQAYAVQRRITFPLVQGRKGHPVIFPAAAFPLLHALRGEQTLHYYLLSHPEECTALEWPDPGCCADLDTAEDLRRLKQGL